MNGYVLSVMNVLVLSFNCMQVQCKVLITYVLVKQNFTTGEGYITQQLRSLFWEKKNTFSKGKNCLFIYLFIGN